MLLDPLEDKTTSRNQSAEIDLALGEDYQIIWTPSDIVDCDTCASVMISPDVTTSVEAIITHVSKFI